MVVFGQGNSLFSLIWCNSSQLMEDTICYKGTWLNRYDTDSPL